METPQVLNLFWKMMFGKDFQLPIDPNRPENLPRLKYNEEKKAQGVKAWLSSGGEQVMQDMMEKIRRRMFDFAYMDLETEGGKENAFNKLKLYQMEVSFLNVLLDALQKSENDI